MSTTAFGVLVFTPTSPLVLSILNTEVPLPFWILTAVVEEMFWVMPPNQETFSKEAPEVEAMFSKLAILVPLPCRVSWALGVVVPKPAMPCTINPPIGAAAWE